MTNPVEIDLETPEADAAEQAATVRGWQDDDPAPAADEENREVEFDDEYR
ncbi:hypothetical protein [Actinoplanes couchii]|uniref:Uncharacterized protein n=1 Tax=Actinoplanes couchii TaxID=403638 RepID=A0ABQ3XJQ4_9ACTN|nr:hypothetical protein [Actinoplanes couchii]MDR6324217.1 hypothetical protein [Actinoplanes couchii]GID58723.1 hypothetical protein Aco03nite_071270 [Actinoplanes couchii]